MVALALPYRAHGQAEGDLNGDGILDGADVTVGAMRIAGNPTTPSVKLQLDFNRDGLLDRRDAAFLAEVLVGLHGFLPQFHLSDRLTGEIFITNLSTLPYLISVTGADGAFTVTLGDTTLLAGSGSGQSMATFDLQEGTNLFELIYADVGGNELKRLVEVRRDTVAPEIQIDSPEENALFQSLTVDLTGQALDGQTPASVTVNDVPMISELDGRFHGSVVFNGSGPRTLTATARDAAGNEAATSRKIELFVSAEKVQQTGEVKIDLPTGALCRQGESVTLENLTNADIKAMLGPGSDGLLTSPPPGGLADGMIVLPNAMMVAVESGVVPETGLTGEGTQPMFATRPVISLQNTSGADNSMPVWIFQVIPDSDGDGQPELSLVSRARVEDQGPNAGRVVPIDPTSEDGLPGTFAERVPVFEDATLPQIQGVAAVDRLRARLKSRQQAGQEASARVTFFCCAASAVIPVRGVIKCESSNIPQINNRIIELQEDLLNLGVNLQMSSTQVAEAEQKRIDAVESIAGFTKIPGTDTKVPTLINGRAFGCLKNFVGGAGAEAALEQIDMLNNILSTIGDIDTILTEELESPGETALRISSLSLEAYDQRIKNWAENASTAEWKKYREQFIDRADAIMKYKDILSKISVVIDCGTLVKNTLDLIDSWTVIVTGDQVAESESAAYDTTLALFKRYSDCKRQLAALGESARADPALNRWLTPQVDLPEISQKLQGLAGFMDDALRLESDYGDFGIRLAQELHDSNISYARQSILLEQFQQLVMREIALRNQRDRFFEGFDAVVSTDMLAPAIVARIQADATLAQTTTAAAIREKGGFSGAVLTMQNIGSPFSTMSSAGGAFTHYVFTALSVEGTPPNRIAVLDNRLYMAAAQGLGGLLNGFSSGESGRFTFPFTPFNTVDFDVMVNIGDIFIASAPDTANQPPSVTITRPAEGFNVPAGFPLRVETQSSDDVGVLGVDLLVGSVSQVGLDGGAAKGIVHIGQQLGPVEIKAVAVDPAGNTGTDTVTINVVDGAGAFTIVPPEDHFVQGSSRQFQATFLGQPAQNVIWKVNGFAGGIAETLGSISPTGFYETTMMNTGGVAAYLVMISAELQDFPGFEAKARVLVVDSGDMIASPLAFSFAAPGAPGGLLAAHSLAFSFPSPAAPGALLSAPPLAFSFPAPIAAGGSLAAVPLAFQRD